MTVTATLRDFPPVTEAVERPETFRQSLLAKHDRCPRAAYLYLKYDGGTETHEKTRGTLFHRFRQRAVQTMLEMTEPRMPGDVGVELADAIMAEDPRIVISTAEQDVVRLMAFNWCVATLLDLDALIGVEVPLEMEIGGVTVTGTLDELEVFGSTLYITDAKTGLNIKKREEIQRDGFQGKLYSLMALFGVHRETGRSIGAGINDVNFKEEYPRYRTDDGDLITKEGHWTRPELVEFRVSLERNIASFLRSLETGEWEARDGSWCSQCPAQTECPIPAHLRYIEQITTPEEAADAFTHKMALERESARLQKGMRGWVEENGPIFVGDYVFDAKAESSREIVDWNELLAAMLRTTELGVPFDLDDHVRPKNFTKFAKRRMTEEEQNES